MAIGRSGPPRSEFRLQIQWIRGGQPPSSRGEHARYLVGLPMDSRNDSGTRAGSRLDGVQHGKSACLAVAPWVAARNRIARTEESTSLRTAIAIAARCLRSSSVRCARYRWPVCVSGRPPGNGLEKGRDSGHADYDDSAALWLYSGVCAGWGTRRGTHARVASPKANEPGGNPAWCTSVHRRTETRTRDTTIFSRGPESL
jgi:hypothetical protein